MAENKTYTEDESNMRAELAVAQARFADMQTHVLTLKETVFDNHKAMKDGITELKGLILNHNDKIDTCRRDLRVEIERDFVTKQEFISEMGKLESKVDRLSTRIVTAVSIIVFSIQIGFKFWGG